MREVLLEDNEVSCFSAGDMDTLMAELYLVLLNFIVCFVNLLNSKAKETKNTS